MLKLTDWLAKNQKPAFSSDDCSHSPNVLSSMAFTTAMT